MNNSLQICKKVKFLRNLTYEDRFAASVGSMRINTAPSPGVLLTERMPPCPSTMDLARGSPRPRPCLPPSLLLLYYRLNT